MTTIRAYNHKKDFNTLILLHKSQNSNIALVLQPSDLPRIGYVSEYIDKPITIGFLRLVEGKYAMIDTLVTDAEVKKEIRHQCLSLLIDTLINKAKQLNLNGIISFTSNEDVLLRATNLNFKVIPHTVISLKL